ncbi:MipA/OmpV family protein [Sphingomonas ginkgonis]|uniref:MipA/OmpV family protein n=1 Tax=Sphingomonas ginkgonis TaxID=2315330 RepID=A0A3R9WNJ9_9SPHN|nr:MipA/OmpV family protein [Sphingomonas ginkgonis]RST29704.1 MipA/OmpV family protein [Sphingomonas ginkgonis]
MRMIFAALATALLAGTPAWAQSESKPLPDPFDNRDTLTIGAAAAFLPDYEGSDDYRFIPAPVIRGRVSGHSFYSKGSYVYFDLVPRTPGKFSFNAGPIAGVRFNRRSKIHDPVVDLLPRRKTAIELGAFAGVSLSGLTNPYDSLGVHVDVVHDVAGAHRSTVITPSVDFATPLSRHTYVSLSASADFVGDRYARYYYSISPAEAVASGLPAFDASGGYKNWKLSLIANQSLTGDLLHGLSLFGTGSYARLQNDFRRSPIVNQRGSPTQWLGAVGLAYTW